jgi:hypothetical protein
LFGFEASLLFFFLLGRKFADVAVAAWALNAGIGRTLTAAAKSLAAAFELASGPTAGAGFLATIALLHYWSWQARVTGFCDDWRRQPDIIKAFGHRLIRLSETGCRDRGDNGQG